ncbi:glutamate-5-semialdehyde dehydrogenase [Paramicrobacterium agarici]|uniref:glutamate-5-semialdehyde dehydrogenase n=1 Tax=Paramicrobacterium agarici TaxID=630514 RepID=UPI0011537BFA|nr:glutamate-5-semialdehyde dehydrogenase [Microbacterium agarici]TQO24235.1 glutamate-5-semialdehyde dehydrogenase [Microbacterium agarici]
MTDTRTGATVRSRLEDARRASRALALATGSQREAALEAIAVAIESDVEGILSANERDIVRGRENGLAPGLLDRLRLDENRIAALAESVRHIAALTDPVGQVVRGSRLENGVRIEQVRVPFGVVGAIYEARPNVTVDIAALALRSGNAVVLRGGSAAIESNTRLTEVLRRALSAAGLPAHVIQSIDDFGREGATELMRARGLVDVLIPRGSASLINTVVSESTVPVIETGAGVVHVYVDADADVATAASIVVNAKAQRPSVCNAAETVLVHRDAAERVLPALLEKLRSAGVTVRGDDEARAYSPAIEPAAADEWSTEHLDLTLGMRIVDSLDDALEHIAMYSTHHTESIVTNSVRNSERFLAEVDSAVVMVNASTRFTDGGVFGFGAEVGISTQKLHARGPMGLTELTSTKWLVRGDGQVRG